MSRQNLGGYTIDTLTKDELTSALNPIIDSLAFDKARGIKVLKTQPVRVTATSGATFLIGGGVGPKEGYTWRVGRIIVSSNVATAVSNSSVQGTGTQTSPGAGTLIATTGAAQGGVTVVNWSVSLAGTLAAADTNNFGLYNGATLIATSLNSPAAGTYPQPPITSNNPFGNAFNVKAIGAGTVGAIYGATVVANVTIPGDSAVWTPLEGTDVTDTSQIRIVDAPLRINTAYTPGSRALFLSQDEQIYASVTNGIAGATYTLRAIVTEVPTEMISKLL